MKKLLLLLILSFSGTILFSQQAQFVTNTSMIKVTAIKNGEGYEWENKDLHVSLDYKTGKFFSRIKNSDLLIQRSIQDSRVITSLASKNIYSLELFP